jgi:hypothetical protein
MNQFDSLTTHKDLILFNRCGRTMSATRNIRFGIGRTVPAIRDTRVSSRYSGLLLGARDSERPIRPNAATTGDYRAGLCTLSCLVK